MHYGPISLRHAISRPITIFFVAIGGLFLSSFASAVDHAPYNVIHQDDSYELRTYQNLVLATVSAPPKPKKRNVFGALFGYISGENKGSQKIKMTAPVFMEYPGSEMESMSFVLPDGFTLASSPTPNDQTIALTEVSNIAYATVRFSGRLTSKRIKKHREKLLNWIAQQGYTITGEAKAAGYNAPYVLPFLRRNEILIPVDWAISKE